ncbi:hypothetical protein [Lacticaseibacillus sharpeae]|uniref:hypothetical protein n=1 Tax=Lacticaseibacillus sharpeae TaxID=1626 RepID=UPI0006D161C6|nr:hypothetical protein [Lacticaseibacillus sharpeae]
MLSNNELRTLITPRDGDTVQGWLARMDYVIQRSGNDPMLPVLADTREQMRDKYRDILPRQLTRAVLPFLAWAECTGGTTVIHCTDTNGNELAAKKNAFPIVANDWEAAHVDTFIELLNATFSHSQEVQHD